jgi:hypothetical protein
MTHKIRFEHKELKALHETEIFRIKYSVLDKVAHLLGSSSEELKKVIGLYKIPVEAEERRAKIFRGENYRHLPYVVMDYPAVFGKEDVFAYRTMFWWGNFFSFTLHLGGVFLEKYNEHLKQHLTDLKGHGIYFCVNTTPWQYHYEPDNYILLDKVGKEEFGKQISAYNFIKLSTCIKITEWELVSRKCADSFQMLVNAAGVERK